MKMFWQKTTWEQSIRSNTALSISNVVLAIVAAAAVMHSYSVKETTILTPPKIDEEMMIGWDSANQAYIKSFGLYATMLVANITASNATFVADTLGQFFDSSIYASVRKTILSTADTRLFKEAAGSTKFDATSVIYEAQTNKVFVVGELKSLASVGQQEVKNVIYEMTIKIKERRPIIYSFESYAGIAPHTQEWLAQQPKQPEQESAHGVSQQ